MSLFVETKQYLAIIFSIGSEDYLNEITETDITKGNVWQDDQGLVCVAWEGRKEEVDRYPSVWLRDNCQCPDCFDPSSRQRKLLLRNFDADIQPVSTTFLPETNEVVHELPLRF